MASGGWSVKVACWVVRRQWVVGEGVDIRYYLESQWAANPNRSCLIVLSRLDSHPHRFFALEIKTPDRRGIELECMII